jgi:hypothetical protein
LASTTGFPDATNTGVPAGVVLKPSGSIVINTPGAVIEGLNITGTVIINAPNVTLKNCSITSGDYDVVLVKPGITGAVVQNCNIDNQGSGGQGIAGQGSFLNNNIQHAADGIDVRGDNTLIQGNYIHNMSGTSDSHFDGIQADGGFSNLTINHNTVINEQGQTSAVMLDNYWGPIDKVSITDNLLVGGGYSVYINEVAQGQAGGGKVTNVNLSNNHLGAGTYGTLDLRTELGDQPVISGNTNDGHTLAQSLVTTGQPPAGSTSTAPTSPPPATTPPDHSATTIASYSQDSGVKGDHITNDSTLTLSGTAAANGMVKILDGTSQIGTATASSSGAWTYTTPTLADGNHSIVAKGATTASDALAVHIDTVAPHAPTITATLSGKAVTDVTNLDHLTLTGTAEANSTVHVFDGTKEVGTATANASGAWSDSLGVLTNGSHSFTAKAVDAAANTSAASSAAHATVHDPVTAHDPAPPTSSSVAFTDVHKNWNGTVTLTGTAGDNSHVNIYGDGATKAMGTVTANADGAWSFTTTSAVSNTEHNFVAKMLDSTGHVVGSSGQADIGSNHSDSIVSSPGNDIMAGGSRQDTFVFGANFGKDVITDFRSSGYNHDIIQISKSVFDNFADVLSHATQSGHDVVIGTTAGDTLTLKQTVLSDLHKSDFHIA